MATTIALRAAGTVATGSTSVAPVAPAGSALDLLVLFVANKHGTTPTVPGAISGWDLEPNGQFATASGQAIANDTGDIYFSAYTRPADGSAADSPTIALTGGNVAAAWIDRYYQTDGRTGWLVASHGAADNATGSTTIALTAGGNPGMRTNDVLLVSIAINSDATSSASSFSTPDPTVTGATVAAMTTRAYGETATGADIAVAGWDAEVTAGASSAAPSFSSVCNGTNGTNLVGVVLFVRLRAIGLHHPGHSIFRGVFPGIGPR